MSIKDRDSQKKKAEKNGTSTIDSQIKLFKNLEVFQKDENKSYKLYVHLEANLGGSTDNVATLGAELRHRDEKPTIVVLNQNDEIIFEEIRPDIKNFKVDEELEELEEELERVEFIISEFKFNAKVGNKPDEDEDRKNRMTELGLDVEVVDGKFNNLYQADWEIVRIELLQKIDHLECGEVNYVKYWGGVPHYTFELMGYFKLPVGRTKNNLLKIPSTQSIDKMKILTKIESEQNQDEETSFSKFAMGLGFLVLALLIGANIWVFAKQTGSYSDGVETLGEMSNTLGEAVVLVNQMVNPELNVTEDNEVELIE